MRRRRTRLRSTADPTFFDTVKPTRTGPPSSRLRACNTNAAVGTLTPVAAARKSARCLSRSMGTTPAASRSASGTESLAPLRPALGNDLAATHGGHAGAKTVTALAHQLAGLISPLHGLFSAGRYIPLVAVYGRLARLRGGKGLPNPRPAEGRRVRNLGAYRGGRPCSSMRGPAMAGRWVGHGHEPVNWSATGLK